MPRHIYYCKLHREYNLFFSNVFNRYLLAFYNFFSFTQKYLSIWYLRSVVFQIYFCCQLEKNTTLLVTYHRKRDHTVSRWYETFARPRKSPSFFSLDHFCFTSGYASSFFVLQPSDRRQLSKKMPIEKINLFGNKIGSEFSIWKFIASCNIMRHCTKQTNFNLLQRAPDYSFKN